MPFPSIVRAIRQVAPRPRTFEARVAVVGLAVALGLLAVGCNNPPPHPNLFYNQRELLDIRNKVVGSRAPYAIQYKQLRARAQSASVPNPDIPDSVYRGRNIKAFRNQMEPQAQGAIANALVYALAVDGPQDRDDAADKVRRFLLAWARHSLSDVTTINDLCTAGDCNRFDTGLMLAVGGLPYVGAYDLVLASGVLSDADRQAIGGWLRKVYGLTRAGTFLWNGGPPDGPKLCHRRSNHTAHHIALMAGIGFVLGDSGYALEAITGKPFRQGEQSIPYHFDSLLADQIYIQGQPSIGCDGNQPTFTGEIVDRYRHLDKAGVDNKPDQDPSSWDDSNRGFGYSLITAGYLGYIAEMARHFGGSDFANFAPSRNRDLFRQAASNGERLDLPARYLARYKELTGPGHKLIPPSSEPGASSYVNEVMKDGYNGLFEWMSARYHHDALITRALKTYDRAGIARAFFDPLVFGRVYDPQELAFEFHLDGIGDGWTPRGGAAQLSAYQITGGQVSLRTTGADPGLELRGLNLPASDYSAIAVRMRVTADASTPPNVGLKVTQVFWNSKPAGPGEFGTLYNDDGQMREIVFQVATRAQWTGTITSLRFDPVNQVGLGVEIESIRLLR